jgi:hypothetical protein
MEYPDTNLSVNGEGGKKVPHLANMSALGRAGVENGRSLLRTFSAISSRFLTQERCRRATR